MIDYLKKLTIKNAGFDIIDRGDCQLLSELIIEKTDETVSYNTLRRMFGLASYVKPSKSTLDTLARFNGYKNYIHYLKINPFEAYWSDKEQLYSLINDESEEIIKFVNTAGFKNEHALDFMISLCRELIYLNKIEELEHVFQSNFFNNRDFSYSEIIHFGNSVGILFKTKQVFENKLLSNANFLKFVYTIHVDYSGLNGYYGTWCKYVSENTTDIQVKYFSQAILQLINYLNGKSVSYTDFDSVDTAAFHPILKGRLFSVKILSGDYNSYDVNKFFNSIKISNDSNNLLDYFYEPMITAIISRNFLLMGLIKKFLSNQKFNIKYYYQEHHRELYELMCLFHSYYLDKEFINKDEIENNILKSEFKYSYKEIIQLFIAVYNYHNDKNDSNTHFKKFEAISKKLNYPIFLKEYLINYFESTNIN
ncbi:MAG: hypothetical protein CK517_02645 [Flavobacteriales bacterium]|nr:MAG: hypothetical protein CK517_02645 [Flavobacteriales bacterium]